MLFARVRLRGWQTRMGRRILHGDHENYAKAVYLNGVPATDKTGRENYDAGYIGYTVFCRV